MASSVATTVSNSAVVQTVQDSTLMKFVSNTLGMVVESADRGLEKVWPPTPPSGMSGCNV